MGWLQSLRSNNIDWAETYNQPSSGSKVNFETDVPHSTHVEDISLVGEIVWRDGSLTPQHAHRARKRSPEKFKNLPFATLKTRDSDLPFLSPVEIERIANGRDKDAEPRHYVVIDEVVYDCTLFVHEHPGGRRVLQTFVGQDCSWQFWRFHSKDVMDKWGRPLRVARTKGVQNRFIEQPRYVGLRKFGAAEEDDW